MSTKPSANWKFAQKDPLIQRSSHTLSVSSDGSPQAYIFGGELNPREPRDNDVHVVDLQDSMQRRQPIFGHLNTKPNASPEIRIDSFIVTIPEFPKPSRWHSVNMPRRKSLRILRSRRRYHDCYRRTRFAMGFRLLAISGGILGLKMVNHLSSRRKCALS